MPTIAADKDGGTTARTARLTLRPAADPDAAAIAGLSNDRAVLHNLSFLPYPVTVGDVERLIGARTESRCWLVAVRSDGGQMVGAAGIHAEEEGAEIGFWLGREFWGQGYATEIAQAVVAVARALGHQSIWALVLPDNAASIRVLEKAGFVRDGQARRWYVLCGAEMTVHRYRLAGDRR